MFYKQFLYKLYILGGINKYPCKLIQLLKLVTEILHVTLSLTEKAHIVIEMLHITLALTGEIYRYNMTEMLHVITDN